MPDADSRRCSRPRRRTCRATTTAGATSSSGTACARWSTSTAGGRGDVAQRPGHHRVLPGAARDGGVARLDARSVLDGELVAFDAEGRPSVRRAAVAGCTSPRRARSVGWSTATPVTYLVFDLLYLDGRSLLDVPYAERRAAAGRARPARSVAGRPRRGSPAAARPCSRRREQQRLEGIVAKRLDSPLPARAARSTHWLKLKNMRMQEVVDRPAGSPARAAGRAASARCCSGCTTADGLQYVGQRRHRLHRRDAARPCSRPAAAATAEDSPFADADRRGRRADAHWVKPELVGEVDVLASGPATAGCGTRRGAGLRPDKRRRAR